MIDKILAPVLSLGGMGLAFGSLLAYASQKFAVEVDERVPLVIEALPGANCGGCGYAGCGAFAAAVVEGKAPVNGCPVGGASCAANVAEIMGVTAGEEERKIARVLCQGTKDNAREKYEYYGVDDCVAASKLGGGSKGCAYGCTGLGTCVKVCPFDAIKIQNGIAVIDEKKCTACGKCVSACPKNIIELVPESAATWVVCKSRDRGPEVKTHCDVGCIACKICEKACRFDAIKVENNIAVIDYSKCVNCSQCVVKCPKKIIHGNRDMKKAYINEEACIGCTICTKQCKFDAIEGELKNKHKIIEDKCVGCGQCVVKCPKKCIEMK
ncbi:RnfABCDGE type electron transport complex subunit B [Petroclostridium sp. X23]|uniref:RnfABCDGE type electron transport complex subunit B n=1 Tax=Petroclostridium sp. X23 TaxID=3045146 RepID=UPI0024ADD5F1|nr:Fe-S cluster domain-containing protein [Petroclostridium sp. X23]WHH61039.1 Fe-S cluster domain-containing protein [Petroclostridium sp. X23]